LESIEESADELMMMQVSSTIESSRNKIDDYADVSKERSSIISIVKGLEDQVETAFKLKEVLEDELEATQNQLSEELADRAELEEQVKTLQPQAALVDQLREDVTYAEEERNKYANLLSNTQPQLEKVTKERNSLAQDVNSLKAQAQKIEGEKVALEAQVLNLKDRITDMNRLYSQLDKVTKDIRKKLTSAEKRVAHLCIQLEEQQAANRELIDAKSRADNEIQALNANNKATKNELKMFQKHDIRSEAARSSGRVRRRYLKPKKKK
jgi:chromosome segregation ATPase